METVLYLVIYEKPKKRFRSSDSRKVFFIRVDGVSLEDLARRLKGLPIDFSKHELE